MDEKLNTGEDWVPAELLTNRTAIIKGISLNAEICFGDLVLYNYNKQVTQVIKKNSNTICFHYRFKPMSLNDTTYVELEKYFLQHGLRTEQIAIGAAVMSIPLNIPEEKLDNIFLNAPIECWLIEQENTIDESDDFDFE